MKRQAIIFTYSSRLQKVPPPIDEAVIGTMRKAGTKYGRYAVLTPDGVSRIMAGRLAARAARELGIRLKIKEVPEAYWHDFEQCYALCMDWLKKSWLKRYKPGDLVIDYTGGMRDITFGLLLAGWALGITGYQRAVSRFRGRGRAEIQKLEVMTRPGRILNDQGFALARSAFERGNYEAAGDIMAGLDTKGLVLAQPKFGRLFARLCEFYLAWDQFDHPKAKDIIDETLSSGAASSQCQRAVPNLARVRRHLGLMTEAARRKGARPGAEVLADLLNNAERCFEQGRYDDAVARLYRCLEALAETELDRCGIDKNDVDPDKAPPGEARQLCLEIEPTRGKRRLALFRSFQLLSLLDDAGAARLGRAFMDNPGLHQRLEARNQSILAHGLRTVRAVDYKGLREQVLELVRMRFSGIDRLMAEIAFPKTIAEPGR